jgi:hypothetical protein
MSAGRSCFSVGSRFYCTVTGQCMLPSCISTEQADMNGGDFKKNQENFPKDRTPGCLSASY